MKKVFNIIFVFFMVLLFACGGKETKLTLTGDDSKDIIGIWTTGKKNVWFEIKTDTTYDQGQGSTVKTSGQKYILDAQAKTITLKSSKGEKKDRVFSYKFENNKLALKAKGKDKSLELKKVEQRPTDK